MNNHKLSFVLLLVVLVLVLKNLVGEYLGFNLLRNRRASTLESFDVPSGGGVALRGGAVPESISYPMPDESVPPSDSRERMVVENSSFSLLVNDVSSSVTQIKSFAEGAGGYMVEANVSKPEEGTSGWITVRVPTAKVGETKEYLRSIAQKVVSENLEGTDVTDQYENLEEKLKILARNKTRFEEIMAQATTVSQILEVQREIFNLQSQIDQLEGRKKYLEQTAKLSKITIYLSTDELALPFAPSDNFRISVIFKRAVRSLMLALRSLVSLGVWVGVYSVIWVPVLVIFWLVRRRFFRRQ